VTEAEARGAVRAALAEVAPEVDPASLADDVELTRQVDLDSMDFLAFVTAIHALTGVDVPERDYPRLATLAGAAAYLAARRGG
jgi:acyl carrier protein